MGGYAIAFVIQMCIAVLLSATLPLWNKVGHPARPEAGKGVRTLTVAQTLAIPA